MIVKYPLSTEKAVRLMESENKLLVVVDKNATKAQIKKEMEKVFKIKVNAVRTLITKGQKRAYVTLDPETPAINVMTELGLM